MVPRDTSQALSELTDEGVFELIATAVLREANPLCAGLVTPGINVKGKTKKGPLDGIAFVQGADPPHLVAVHHTTTAPRDLKKKWLHDPATVKPRKAAADRTSAPTGPGDLVKTAKVVHEERMVRRGLRATLILTTNTEPDEDLVREVDAAGTALGIDVDIWSLSRLAHWLDNSPTGQWIRYQLLGVEQQLLSRELLGELSKRSLALAPTPDHPSAWVSRTGERAAFESRRRATFLVAESGQGKSVACRRALEAHIEDGSYGLVLTHELIERSLTLEQAISEELRHLHAALAPGQSPFPFCSMDHPLLVVIEDINRSAQPQRLAEKLVSWVKSESTEPGSSSLWRLLCPIWPQILDLVGDQVRRVMEPMTVFLEPLSAEEGKNAVMVRAELSGTVVSEVTADETSTALGHDPLLIALHEFDGAPDPTTVVERFVERCLMRAQIGSGHAATDLLESIMSLAREMLSRRRLDPSWREVSGWGLSHDVMLCLSRLAVSGELLRLSGPSTDQRLLFRHDRVREWLLVASAAEMEKKDELADGVVADPFFAEVLGAVIVKRQAPAPFLRRLQVLNPLALFHALRRAPSNPKSLRDRILEVVEKWLGEPTSRGGDFRTLRWEALGALAGTDHPEVPRLVRLFPENATHGQLARLRNGDLGGGIELCQHYELGLSAHFRDRQIAHAKMHFGPALVRQLAVVLRSAELFSRSPSGVLHLAGQLADPQLARALEECWSADTSRNERLADYLYAFAMCAEEATAAKYLDPVCALWGGLSDKSEGHHRSPRNAVGSYGLDWAFQQRPPVSALSYFVARAERSDLAWQITYMLSGVDHPIAIEFTVEKLAKRIRKSGRWAISMPPDRWRRAGERGEMMSRASREVCLRLWRDPSNDSSTRIAAFSLWAATQEPGDVAVLRAMEAGDDLAGEFLAQRLFRGDSQAVPALIEKLHDRTDRNQWWWFHAPRVWCPELAAVLDETLNWRRQNVSRTWADDFEDDWRLRPIVMRLPVPEAERVLLRHWDHLRFSSDFVQTALYVATPELCRLVADVVRECPDPSSLFGHLAMHYGVRTVGEPGITREHQVLVLEPYLPLLSEFDIGSLADACNQGGWFETRRRLLDPRLTERWQYHSWRPELAAAEFDELAEKRGIHWVDLSIDRALKAGVSWCEFLDAMTSWLNERRSASALKLMAQALRHHGTRGDLVVLNGHEATGTNAAALIADTIFAVNRRSLE